VPISPDRLRADIDELAPTLRDVAARIHAHPELRFEEHRAAAWLAEAIEAERLSVDRGVGGLSTAFRARVGRSDGPTVAILAEYDALPEIGHACGHNLIAAGALGAFLALARQANELPGSVMILGTPAEEGGGGKVRLLDAGVFAGVDAAMMFHPFDRDLTSHFTLANGWIELRFHGRPSHAAIAPHEGASALTACMSTFHLVDAQRVHFRDGVRVHGYVTDGGQAVNVIPERAAAEFSVRATTLAELERVKSIVLRCARGAALACDVELEVTERRGYKDLRTSTPIARRFGEHLAGLGRAPLERDPRVGAGSTDMGDVSHAVPSIHPWIAICDEGETTCHQRAFADCAASERGYAGMLDAARAMALTTRDLLEDASLLEAAKREFEARRGD
jgi:amidohydrolase